MRRRGPAAGADRTAPREATQRRARIFVAASMLVLAPTLASAQVTAAPSRATAVPASRAPPAPSWDPPATQAAPAASATIAPAAPAVAPHEALPIQQSADVRGNAVSSVDWCKVNDCQPRVFGIDVARLTTAQPVALSGEGFGNRTGGVILSSDRGDRSLDIVKWTDTRIVASAATVSGVLDGTVALKVRATSGRESVPVAVPFVAARERRQVPIFSLQHCDRTTWDNVCQPDKASPIVDAWHMDWCGSSRDPLGSFAVCTGWPQGVDVYVVRAPTWFSDHEIRVLPHQCSGACEVSYELKANAVAPGVTAVYVRWKGPPKTQVGYKLWAEGYVPRGIAQQP